MACPLSIGSSEYSDHADPGLINIRNQLDQCKRYLYVMYVVVTLLLCLVLLTLRIARTYKLSLAACESKLQALIIHAQEPPRYVYSDSIPPSRYRTSAGAFVTPVQNTRLCKSESNLHQRRSPRVRDTHYHTGSMSNSNVSPFEIHAHNDDDTDETNERRGSIWKTVGDYVIHIKENGEIESHHLQKDKEEIIKTNQTKLHAKIQDRSPSDIESEKYAKNDYNRLKSGSSGCVSLV
eukprot:649043_1